MDDSVTPDAQTTTPPVAAGSISLAPEQGMSEDTAPIAAQSAARRLPLPRRGAPRPTIGSVPARWLRLTRPPTLVLGVAPIVVTLVLLWNRHVALAPVQAASTLLAVILGLAAANMLDEHLELERTSGQTWLQEPGGGYYAGNVLDGSGVASVDALRGSIVLFVLSALVGVPAILAGGPLVSLLGVVGLGAAFLYSATNFALKRLPAGEIASMLLLGPGLVIVTVLVQHQPVTRPEVLIGIALGLLAGALIESAHLRDGEIDRRMGRRTLVVLLGEHSVRVLYVLCIIVAYVLVLAAALPHGGTPGAIGALLSLPAMALPLTGALRAQGLNVRHLVVRQSLRAYAAFALWLCIGLIADDILRIAVPFIAGLNG